jgi:hypothetical protein
VRRALQDHVRDSVTEVVDKALGQTMVQIIGWKKSNADW